MLLEENLAHLFLLKNKKATLKNNIDHCLDSTLYHAMYRCIAIHKRQYVTGSTKTVLIAQDRKFDFSHKHKA